MRLIALIGVACLASCVSLAPASVFAQTSYPMLMSVKPVAVQAGATAEVTVASRYSLDGAYQVLVSGVGVAGEPLPPPPPTDAKQKPNVTALKVKFTAAADAIPGVRDFRVVTPRGVSTVGQLVVTRDPVIVENGPNDKPEQALAVTLPATLCGAIEKSEDVDYYKFRVDAPTQYTFHVRSSRLQDRIHDLQTHSDPIVTIRTAAGQTLAANDNFFYGDPLLTYRFEQPGEYLLEIRDVRYEGNASWEYCIEANARPFVENVFPLGVARGSQVAFNWDGFPATAAPTAPVSIAADAPLGPLSVRLPIGNELSDPALVEVTDLPLVEEAGGDNNALDKAQTLAIPSAVNGRLEVEADVDYYSFEAKKGETLSFEVVARRRQSRVDSHLRVLNEKGQQLAQNDDLRKGKRNFADSWIENWTAPADGKYVIELRDVHLRGGSAFPYFLRVTRSQPYFELYLDTDKTLVAPGSGGVIFCRVERKGGFTGPIDLHIEGLPHGVTASCGRILGDKSVDGCIVLAADHDAPLSASAVTITGTASHTLPDGQVLLLGAVAAPYQEIYLPGGGRGHWQVDQHVVSVTGYGDIRYVRLSEYDLTLKPGESKSITVTVDRSPEFSQNVLLEMVYQHLGSVYGNSLPPGVTIDDKSSKTLLAGGATEGVLTLKAAADAAPAERQQACVMANVSINFVMKATYASRPVTITILKKD